MGWLTENTKILIPYQEKLHDVFEEDPITRPIKTEEADEAGEEVVLKAFKAVRPIYVAKYWTCSANKSRPIL